LKRKSLFLLSSSSYCTGTTVLLLLLFQIILPTTSISSKVKPQTPLQDDVYETCG
jgi:hypothetical protein